MILGTALSTGYLFNLGLPDSKRASLVAQSVKNPPAMQETWVPSLRQEDLLEKGMLLTPVFLPGEFPGQSTWHLFVLTMA